MRIGRAGSRRTHRVQLDGVPAEYLDANKQTGGPEQWAEFETKVRARYDQMIRITIEPAWAKLLDFETTIPSAVEDIVRRKQLAALPDGYV